MPGQVLGGTTLASVLRQSFCVQYNPFSKQQCSVQALTGSYLGLICPNQLNQAPAENDYHDNCRAQWEVQTVTHCPGWGGSKSCYQGHT